VTDHPSHEVLCQAHAARTGQLELLVTAHHNVSHLACGALPFIVQALPRVVLVPYMLARSKHPVMTTVSDDDCQSTNQWLVMHCKLWVLGAPTWLTARGKALAPVGKLVIICPGWWDFVWSILLCMAWASLWSKKMEQATKALECDNGCHHVLQWWPSTLQFFTALYITVCALSAEIMYRDCLQRLCAEIPEYTLHLNIPSFGLWCEYMFCARLCPLQVGLHRVGTMLCFVCNTWFIHIAVGSDAGRMPSTGSCLLSKTGHDLASSCIQLILPMAGHSSTRWNACLCCAQSLLASHLAVVEQAMTLSKTLSTTNKHHRHNSLHPRTNRQHSSRHQDRLYCKS
jgi:hypothetical protein